MIAIPALSRLRRASDDAILAERLEPPYTPIRWPGGALEPPTDVYAEVVDTDGQLWRSPTYRTPDSALFRYAAGDDIAALGGSFSRASSATYVDADGMIRTAPAGALRDGHYIRNPVTGLMERSTLLEALRINHVPDNIVLPTWLASQGATLSPTTLLGLPAVRIDGDASASAHGAFRASDIYGSDSQATYSLFLRAHPDIAVLRMGGRNGITTSNTLDIDLRTREFTRLGTGMEAGRIEQVGPDTYYIEYRVMSTAGAVRGFSAFFSDSEGSFDTPDATGLWIEIAGLQVEVAPYASSTILTSGDPGTRATDALSFPYSHPPQPMTVYWRGVPVSGRILSIGGSTFQVWTENNGQRVILYPGRSLSLNANVRHQFTEIVLGLDHQWGATGAVAVNGVVQAQGSLPGTEMPADWDAGRRWLYVNSRFTALYGHNSLTHLVIAPGVRTMEQMRHFAGVTP